MSAAKPIRCKLVVDNKIILQEGKFEYLRNDTCGYGDVETEVRNRAARAMRAAALSHTDWSQS